MPHDVFISHSAKNKAVADAMCAILESSGIRCWVAPRDVPPGATWAQALTAGVRESRAFVLIFSSHSNGSPQVLREVDQAVKAGVPVFPFRLDVTAPSQALDYYISTSHWLDALSPPLDAHIHRLRDTLRVLLDLPAVDVAGTAPSSRRRRAPEPVRVSRVATRVRLLVGSLLLAGLGVGAFLMWGGRGAQPPKGPPSDAEASVDARPPLLAITDPAGETESYSTPVATVRGRATDTDLVRVRMNGKAIALEDDGSFEATMPLSADEETVVEFEAEDRAGHRSAKVSRRLRYELPVTPEPAWRAPLEEAKRAEAAGDWKAASALLSAAKSKGAPGIEIPATLSAGVLTYERPALLEVIEPAEGVDLSSRTVRVSGRLSGRPTDRLWVTSPVNEWEVTVTAGTFSTEAEFPSWGEATIEVMVFDGEVERARVVRIVSLKEPAPPAPSEPPPPVVPSWAKVSPVQVEEAARLKVPVAFENDLGMRFVLVPAGKFTMGSPTTDYHQVWLNDEHEVTLTHAIYVQITETTNGQYRHWKPEHDSGEFFSRSQNGDDQPVGNVSHSEATAFAAWLSGRDRRQYRLPTEAEWERAARSGTTGSRWFGNREDVPRYANFGDKNNPAPGRDRESDDGFAVGAPPGRYPASPWGLYDMLGNVWEWCADWYGDYPVSPVQDPTGPGSGQHRVTRGGSWFSPASEIRAAQRAKVSPDGRSIYHGFRVVAVGPLSGG